MSTVGYFLWRIGAKGRLTPEKILAVHHMSALNNTNSTVAQQYKWNLLDVYSLTSEEWDMSLAALAQKYPYRGPYGTECSNEGKLTA